MVTESPIASRSQSEAVEGTMFTGTTDADPVDGERREDESIENDHFQLQNETTKTTHS
jgi:hypothetical protein